MTHSTEPLPRELTQNQDDDFIVEGDTLKAAGEFATIWLRGEGQYATRWQCFRAGIAWLMLRKE